MRGTHAAGAGTGGGLRPDHALELADEPSRRQGGPGARRRLHHGAQALGIFAVQRHPVGQGHARGRSSRGRVQSRSTATARTSGAPLSSHREIDMVSFTGSTRAGTEVARNAAASVKRVHQELGGKSPNVLLDDADFERAVKQSVLHVFQNSGQSCNAPTRMLVPAGKLAAGRGDREAHRRDAWWSAIPPRTRPPWVPWFRNCSSTASRAYIAKGHRRGRQGRHRRRRPPGGPGKGLLRQADDLLECPQRHDHRARGDLRAGAVHSAVRDRGRGGADRQRHALWPGRLRLVEGQCAGRGASATAFAPVRLP